MRFTTGDFLKKKDMKCNGIEVNFDFIFDVFLVVGQGFVSNI